MFKLVANVFNVYKLSTQTTNEGILFYVFYIENKACHFKLFGHKLNETSSFFIFTENVILTVYSDCLCFTENKV